MSVDAAKMPARVQDGRACANVRAHGYGADSRACRVCVRTSVRACTHMYVHACVNECVHAFLRACVPACVRACVRECVGVR